jgi:hypothetical protein
VSLSGYYLINAAGISLKTLSATADTTHVKGIDLAISKKHEAITSVRNDLLSSLQMNGIGVGQFQTVYDTSEFKLNSPIGNGTYARGVQLHSVSQYNGGLRRTKIKAVQVFPINSGSGKLIIVDGIKTFSWDISLVGGVINIFDNSNLAGFDYTTESNNVKILVQAPDVNFNGSVITCLKGCHGTKPNDCAWADGWDGQYDSRNDGFSVNVQFYCECDYERILCDLAKTFSGELIYLKWQMLLFQEKLSSERFNNIVIYDRQNIIEYVLPNLQQQYNARWNALMEGMHNILNNYHDDCLKCAGLRWVTNV